MPSAIAGQIRQSLNAFRDAPPPANIEESRARLEALISLMPPLPDLQVEAVDIDGTRGEWLSPPGAASERVILYLHGGAYSVGSITTHRDLASRIAAAAGARALVVDYRLAPEHLFPAALEDAVRAYRWLLKKGFSPSRIIVSGDSAGGGLTLALLLSLRAAGDPMPAGAALISPWTDLTVSGESAKTRAAVDPMIAPHQILPAGQMYLGTADARNPLASPVFADLHGLPPLLIHVGNDETLLDDSARVARNAYEAGVDVTLRVAPGMWHVWHASAAVMPEAQLAVDEIGAFVKQRMG